MTADELAAFARAMAGVGEAVVASAAPVVAAAGVLVHNLGACPHPVATGMSHCEACGWVSPAVAVPVPPGGGRSYGRGMAGDPCGGGELGPPA